ncbi:MAG: hypothetical protein ACE5HO_14300 [bacterium]
MNSIIKSSKLSGLVGSICNGKYKESELIEFVNLVQKISLSYLKYQEVIGKHIRWERRNQTGELEDLALDCVAGLFMRNDRGEFIQLNKYFHHNSSCLEEMDDVEILVLLRRLVIKKTKQELSRIFKERDPEGAKIVRNIKVAIKSASDFGTFKEMGREYIYLNNCNGNGVHNGSDNSGTNGRHSRNRPSQANDKNNGKTHSNPSHLRREQPSIPEKSLRGEYLNLFCPKDPVSTGIRKMLKVVGEDERYQNYLPVDMIARIMRNTSIELARDRLTTQVQDPSPFDELKLKEIDKRKIAVLQKIKEKIQNQYVKTEKISASKGTIYYCALCDILEDISQGKKYDSYFRHLKRYMPELTQKVYRTQERTIFEYLGKLIKKWFRESLMELL